jgi:hypothetical protein
MTMSPPRAAPTNNNNNNNNNNSNNANTDNNSNNANTDNDIIVRDRRAQKILWSGVARNDVLLAEAGDDPWDGAVAATARALLRKPATPGYEFHTHRVTPRTLVRRSTTDNSVLKGIKFHVHDHHNTDGTPLVWVFAAVYNPSLDIDRIQVQSFLEKVVGLTELPRDNDPLWHTTGTTLAAQSTFAPILLQRMEEVTYLGKLSMLHERLDASKQIMQDNITNILAQEEQLQRMDEETTRLQDMAAVFQQRSKKVRRMKMMQNAKYGLILGTAVTAGVAIIVIPPLVAIL